MARLFCENVYISVYRNTKVTEVDDQIINCSVVFLRYEMRMEKTISAANVKRLDALTFNSIKYVSNIHKSTKTVVLRASLDRYFGCTYFTQECIASSVRWNHAKYFRSTKRIHRTEHWPIYVTNSIDGSSFIWTHSCGVGRPSLHSCAFYSIVGKSRYIFH